MIQKTPGVGFFGKVRIPTIGHASAIEHAKKIAAKKNGQLHIGLSGTSHPLTPETKREHAEKIFGHPVMPASKHTSNIVSFLSHMNKMHDDFTLVAGQDRADEYHRIISKYNGKADSQGNVPFHFKKWRVHSVERVTTNTKKPPTSMSHVELTKTVSASKLEALANSGNYKHFAAYHPGMPDAHVRKIYNQIRIGNKLSESIGQTLSRDLMPQIKKQDVSGFLQHLKNQGILHKKKEVDSKALKSTQSEFDREKIAALVHAKNKERIFTSNDGHVLDGHHRWLANRHTNQKTKTYEIDLPILELLRQAREYQGGLNEDCNSFDDILKSFTSFACRHLGIKNTPPVIRDSTIEGSFGGYVPSQKCIRLSTKDRHPLDALRTLAHELVHHKQNEDGRLTNPAEDGKTGTEIENEANSIAGVIMRNWAKENPQHFSLQSLTENVAIFVVGVPCSGKDQVIKTLQEAPWINPDLDSWKDERPENHLNDIDLKHYKHVSSAYGHDIYKKETESHAQKIRFTTYAGAKNGKVKIAVKMSTHGDNKSTITGLQATKDNTFKAHDFYHHLITHHGETLHSDAEQSEGAKKVWKRLMRKPGVKFHVHDWSNGKTKPLHPITNRNFEDSNTSLVASKLKEEFQEVDIQALQKSSLKDKVIVSATADKLPALTEAIAFLDNLGYHTSMVYVHVDNDTSKLRNEQRGKRGQRMLKEKTRQVKYDLSESNREILMQIFNEDFAMVDNTPALTSKPKDREWGTKSLTKIYKSMTPGQSKKKKPIIKVGTEVNSDGIGPTAGSTSLGGLGTGYTGTVYEWMTNPRTIERFTNRYGKDAQRRINEVAKLFHENGMVKTAPKTLVNIRESYLGSKPKNNK